MRRLVILPILLAMLIPALAEDWNIGGKVYKNVVVVDRDDDGVRVTYDGGLGEIQYSDLPLDVQKRFGEDYETLQAKKAAADLRMARRDAELAEQQRKQTAMLPANAQPAQPRNAVANSQPTAPPAAGNPALAATATPHPKPTPPPPDPYPGAKYSYNPMSDYCYLDSLPIDLTSQSGAVIKGGLGSVVLRTITEGRRPETPTRIEAVFFTSGVPPINIGERDVILISNGTRATLHATKKNDRDLVSPMVMGYFSYDLTPEQARLIARQQVEFSTGGTVYKIKPASIAQAQQYFSNVASLPPASPMLIRMFNHFLAELPSLVNVISYTCLCILLSGAAVAIILFFFGTTLGALKILNP